MSDNSRSVQRVEDLIRLVRKGNPASLTELRKHLGKTRKEIASKVGVSEDQLEDWELGEQQPSSIHHSFWKLSLSDYIDEEISALLKVDNAELINKFWEVMWHLDE